ncbi:MAG: hypothetical protein ABI830_07520 [Pseudolabrys sp.]
MSDQTAVPGDNLVYTYRPSLLGSPWVFTLEPDTLTWACGNRTGRVGYGAIRRLRMTYRPANMQSHRFITEIWAAGAPKLQLVSSSWKSMVEQERLDKPYAAFVTQLHARLAQAGGQIEFLQGSNPVLYWIGLVVFTGVSLSMAALVARAVQGGAMGGAAFISFFMLLFVWQGGNFFRRNRPGHYRPDALPELLMPKG